ncbi:polyamine-modulated factor 1 isoform X3 [Corythoichthys intestinalis]|uniref:polyamine-modulated factor 1 isoform X3 n=1 Tax=Corythoichthys intestinalis TaxID=161448 RepID=UPI0025A64ED9|nr:polyamine-modulated factor 1 isoform X3 [Corythoichthys intestinalis]
MACQGKSRNYAVSGLLRFFVCGQGGVLSTQPGTGTRMNASESSDRFSSMFHELYKMNPARMENVNKEFVNELQRAIKDAISKLNKEAGIESKLNKLDQLESAAKNSPDPAWRPSGVPEEDFSSSIIPLYQKQEAYWQRKLKKIQAENAALAQKVKAGREKIAQTDQRISTAIAVVGSTAEWEAFSSDLKSQTSSLCPSDVLDM